MAGVFLPLRLASKPHSVRIADVIRIHTLGGLSVRGDDARPLTGAASQPRRMALLALLARAGERGVSREKLLALLWPDTDDERGPRALAQALYALRKDLGADDAISGARELRFDPAIVSSDVAEFTSAVARGDDSRAVALYEGPFLDGFHLPSTDAFSRWAEQERAALAHDYARTLESLARTARTRGDNAESITWWRKLAALDPLNARVTVQLMEALAASGDRAGALKQAHVYQLLVQQELDLPPDREVLILAERVRQSNPSTDAPSGPIRPSEIPDRGATSDARPESRAQPSTESQRTVASETADRIPTPAIARNTSTKPQRDIGRSRRFELAAGAMIVVAIAALGATWARSVSKHRASGDEQSRPIVAIGRIAAFGSDSLRSNLAAPVADLLATSLARVPGVRVVSQTRMLELMHRVGTTGDTAAGSFIDVARRAGAAEVIDGTLYVRPNGTLRLDLRRIDVETGAIGDANSVEGGDVFALVDSGTARIATTLGANAPAGSISEVTTRSVTAYRMYAQGLRAFYLGDMQTALGFFDAALAEDSSFALAAYYGAKADRVPSTSGIRLERAMRLATRATDRERLIILAGWAYSVSAPALRQLAETLSTRYPTETEGPLYAGIARIYEGDFLAGLEPLERVLRMDSLGINNVHRMCAACDALLWRVSAYELVDSLPAAEREARRWLRLQPGSVQPTRALMRILESEGRTREADSLLGITAAMEPRGAVVDLKAESLIRNGEYAAADRLLDSQLRQPDLEQQVEACWYLTLSAREQGRLAAALDDTHRWRRLVGEMRHTTRPPISVLEAQVQFEMGHSAIAAALFDSISRQTETAYEPSLVARNRAWMLAQAAGARLAAGDTISLSRLADSVQMLGAQSGYGRDRRLYHHVRGLLLAARGDRADAISEFKSAIYSVSIGYTRSNYELARLLLRDGKPRAAVAYLQPPLHGSLEASNTYLNRIELHELLAQAWDAAGTRDSAAAHYAVVARAWAAADPMLLPREKAAQARLAALRR